MKIFLKVLMMVGVLVQSGDLFAASAAETAVEEKSKPVVRIPLKDVRVETNRTYSSPVYDPATGKYLDTKVSVFNDGTGIGWVEVGHYMGFLDGVRNGEPCQIQGAGKVKHEFINPSTVNESVPFGVKATMTGAPNERSLTLNKLSITRSEVALVIDTDFLTECHSQKVNTLTIPVVAVMHTTGKFENEPKHQLNITLTFEGDTVSVTQSTLLGTARGFGSSNTPYLSSPQKILEISLPGKKEGSLDKETTSKTVGQNSRAQTDEF